MNSFWEKLAKPFIVLAPMEEVTDFVFRQIITEIGKPDVMFTEFVSCDGLMSNGREKVAESLRFNKNENPIVAQIWGTNPETFLESAKYCKSLGFSGIDINMGCPVKDVVSHGACSALIKNHSLAEEIIKATKEGAKGLPMSVKTRIGFAKPQIEEWIGFLLEQDLEAITVHLRTVSEMSKVDAHWELMSQIVLLRNTISPKTIIIGNGDIKTREEISEKYKEYKCDGFMVGRGIFHNPWIFNSKINIDTVVLKDRMNLFEKHIRLFNNVWAGKKNPSNLKKFAKTYIQNFPGAQELRTEIMNCSTTDQMLNALSSYAKAN